MEKWKANNASHFPTAPAAATGGFFFPAKASDQGAKIPQGLKGKEIPGFAGVAVGV
jgi:hypothetical protein